MNETTAQEPGPQQVGLSEPWPGVVEGVPQAPAWALDEPDKPLVLYRGPGSIAGAATTVTLSQPMTTGILVVAESSDDLHELALGDTDVVLDDTFAGPVTLQGLLTSSSGHVDMVAAQIGAGTLTFLVAHFTNLPGIHPAAPLEESRDGWRRTWSGRLTMEGGGYRLVLDARHGHEDILAAAHGTNRLGVTHVGSLSRIDGAEFTSEAGVDMLFGVQLALSSAFGAWTAPVAPVGFDARGRRVVEFGHAWHADAVGGTQGWCDTLNGGGLSAYVGGFLDRYESKERDAVVHLARHLIAAHHASTTIEARIMLSQAALEYDAWLTFVLSGRMSRTQYGKRDRTSEVNLRELLGLSNIDAAVPAQLSALGQLAADANLTDGPAVITWIRNRLTHPKDAAEPYRIEGLVSEAWRLAIEYQTLRLLYRVGYAGEYVPLTRVGGWAHDRIHVPWQATP